MQLRPYQLEAVERTFTAWESAHAVLGVAATGMGKTILFASIIERHPGRVMVIAHREELIFQAADKIRKVTGLEADIEMADMRAAETSSLADKARVIVSTIQTQTAGRFGGRMHRFNPDEFSLLIIDEAHHATSTSYRRIIKHYRKNKSLRVLGVTATPDRSDEEALGQIFDEVAFEYDIRFGIEDGWLVPVTQTAVHAEGLDLTAVRTTAGDLNGADLARVMEYEKNLHEIAGPTIDLTNGRKTLIFTASLAHAERLCEILNRHRDGSARWVSGKTPKKERRKLFADYAASEFQYLLNVGVTTEGFDEPGIEVIVMARPTKSRSLYSQMVGRGTRPLPGVVDDPDMFGSPAMRRDAIAASKKPKIEVIDFVGNAGKHKLITTADVLGGNYSNEVVQRAKQTVEKDGSGNMMKALDEADEQIRQEREEAQRVETARRAKLVADVSYKTSVVDPFDAFGLTPWREKGWDVGKQPSDKMIAMLERQGIDTEGLSFAEASQLIREVSKRWKTSKCSFKQAKLLASRGLPTDVSRKEATEMINAIAEKEGWQKRTKRTKQTPKPVKVERY